MPFRHWYAQHGFRHPVAYSMLTLAVGMLACMATAVIISVNASDHAIDRSLQQDRLQREQSRQAACLVIDTQNTVYRETPPLTPTGKKAAEAWAQLARAFGCEKR